METFKDFLIKKHADQYHGVDDDMPDDFEQWFHFGLDRNDLIEYADEYAAIQKQEMVEEIVKEIRKIEIKNRRVSLFRELMILQLSQRLE